MSDLISRSALWKAFDFCGVFIERRDRHIAQGLVEEAPAIEAVPVVHGEWIHDINNLYGCSICLNRETMPHNKQKNFCPNCGADMRKKVD